VRDRTDRDAVDTRS